MESAEGERGRGEQRNVNVRKTKLLNQLVSKAYKLTADHVLLYISVWAKRKLHHFMYVFLWLSGRALCQQRKGCVFNFQGTHILTKNV